MSDHTDKVIRIPITYKQRKRNEMGKGYVPCEVSERWLQFPDNVSDYRWITVDVMTMGSDDKPKKICDLIFGKEDIIKAINSIGIKNSNENDKD